MNIVTKRWDLLSDEEQRNCLNLTYKDGAMRTFVLDNSPVCFLAFRRDGVIIGWSIFDITTRSYMTYIHENYRKKGIGTKLAKSANSFAKSCGVEVLRVYAGPFTATFFEKSFGEDNIEVGEVSELHDYIVKAHDTPRPCDSVKSFTDVITGNLCVNRYFGEEVMIG